MTTLDKLLRRNGSKLRRGWIVRILETRQGLLPWINDKMLQRLLSDVGYHVDMQTLHADLVYLEEKGYAELRKPKLLCSLFRMLIVRITAQGVDLIEGATQDATIDFGRDN